MKKRSTTPVVIMWWILFGLSCLAFFYTIERDRPSEEFRPIRSGQGLGFTDMRAYPASVLMGSEWLTSMGRSYSEFVR